jgi:hypothetical protein
MRIYVVVALPFAQEAASLELPEGATLRDALEASRVSARHPLLDLSLVGVWGHRRDLSTVLRDGDRVECYRRISADAKAMRRARALDSGLLPSPMAGHSQR